MQVWHVVLVLALSSFSVRAFSATRGEHEPGRQELPPHWPPPLSGGAHNIKQGCACSIVEVWRVAPVLVALNPPQWCPWPFVLSVGPDLGSARRTALLPLADGSAHVRKGPWLDRAGLARQTNAGSLWSFGQAFGPGSASGAVLPAAGGVLSCRSGVLHHCCLPFKFSQWGFGSLC